MMKHKLIKLISVTLIYAFMLQSLAWGRPGQSLRPMAALERGDLITVPQKGDIIVSMARGMVRIVTSAEGSRVVCDCIDVNGVMTAGEVIDLNKLTDVCGKKRAFILRAGVRGLLKIAVTVEDTTRIFLIDNNLVRKYGEHGINLINVVQEAATIVAGLFGIENFKRIRNKHRLSLKMMRFDAFVREQPEDLKANLILQVESLLAAAIPKKDAPLTKKQEAPPRLITAKPLKTPRPVPTALLTSILRPVATGERDKSRVPPRRDEGRPRAAEERELNTTIEKEIALQTHIWSEATGEQCRGSAVEIVRRLTKLGIDAEVWENSYGHFFALETQKGLVIDSFPGGMGGSWTEAAENLGDRRFVVVPKDHPIAQRLYLEKARKDGDLTNEAMALAYDDQAYRRRLASILNDRIYALHINGYGPRHKYRVLAETLRFYLGAADEPLVVMIRNQIFRAPEVSMIVQILHDRDADSDYALTQI